MAVIDDGLPSGDAELETEGIVLVVEMVNLRGRHRLRGRLLPLLLLLVAILLDVGGLKRLLLM